jgi:hypothetical protein
MLRAGINMLRTHAEGLSACAPRERAKEHAKEHAKERARERAKERLRRRHSTWPPV